MNPGLIVLYCFDCVSGNRNAAVPYFMVTKVGEKADGSPKTARHAIAPGDPDLVRFLYKAATDPMVHLEKNGSVFNPMAVTLYNGRLLCSLHAMDYH